MDVGLSEINGAWRTGEARLGKSASWWEERRVRVDEEVGPRPLPCCASAQLCNTVQLQCAAALVFGQLSALSCSMKGPVRTGLLGTCRVQ